MPPGSALLPLQHWMMEADGEALHGHAFLHRCLTPVLLYEKSNPFSSLISIGFLILAKQLCNGTRTRAIAVGLWRGSKASLSLLLACTSPLDGTDLEMRQMHGSTLLLAQSPPQGWQEGTHFVGCFLLQKSGPAQDFFALAHCRCSSHFRPSFSLCSHRPCSFCTSHPWSMVTHPMHSMMNGDRAPNLFILKEPEASHRPSKRSC